MEFIVSIAGVDLKVDTGPLQLPADALKHGICRRFFSDVAGTGGGLDLRLTGAPAPAVTGYKKIFDSQDSWSIYADQDDLFIVDQYPPYSRPVWTAGLRLNSGRVTIYCDDAVIDPHSRTLALNPIAYPLDQILLMNYLAVHGGGIIHAAGWASKNGRGWVFPGKSGAGKSTLAGLLSGLRGGEVLSDDRIALRDIGDTFHMYGTPWPGEGGFAVNRAARLEGLMFLTKGTENRMVGIAPSAAIFRLLPVLSIPWYDEKKVLSMMDFCENLLKQVPAYEFFFRPDPSAANFLEGVLVG